MDSVRIKKKNHEEKAKTSAELRTKWLNRAELDGLGHEEERLAV